ncbi:MAG: hypothetical protein EOP45_06920 [Sphingobacteriaceae bacterium]|nr:MAG: hypothetical protein EOP45_06920 [Sphingobacteriaceae bacterium]
MVEIGCGSGYMAMLLKKLGSDIICCDIAKGETIGMFLEKGGIPFTNEDGRDLLKRLNGCPERALLMSWGHPTHKKVLTEILDMFKGPLLFIIGERSDGCTFDIDQYVYVIRLLIISSYINH